MADLFSVTAPLRIQVAKTALYVIAECYPHPQGLVYTDLYWHKTIENNPDSCVHLITAELKGGGPWKIANNVIHVLGCHGTNAQLATEYEDWIAYCRDTNIEASRCRLNARLTELGVAAKYLKNQNVVYLDVNNSSK